MNLWEKSMNNVVLIGRITHDLELRATASGTSSCMFSIAINGRTNANGEKHTDFINVVAWRKTAELLCEYCTKGSLIGIRGRLSTRSYGAQDGSKRYVTEVIVDELTFLDNKKERNNSESANSQDEIIITEDDLPF